ncbi:MAG TPA: radical SAM protein, partial [Bdellovibrionales bacterium]|nr:radical SAM protein [Bdellovibrionales bacterium]
RLLQKAAGVGMIKLEEIKQLHLEITTRCNAACPHCARNIYGAMRDPSFDLADISLDEFKTAFPPAFIRQLKHIFMCGTYGEPTLAPDCLEIWKYIRENSHPALTSVSLHTNGGTKTPEWWAELAKHCRLVWFGIDGLEDTNHLYRQHVSWKKLMANVKAFIGAGGYAAWVVNVYKHNEHQVEEMRALSKSLGFVNFVVRKTARFYLPHVGLVTKFPVFTPKGEISHFLEMPTQADHLNVQFSQEERSEAERNDQKAFETSADFIERVRQYKVDYKKKWKAGALTEIPPVSEDVAKRFDGKPICCKTKMNKEIYLSASGLVWPCCFLSVHEWGQGYRQAQMDRIFDQVEDKMDSLNIRKHSLREIVEGDFFQKHIPESWKQPKIGEGRIYECAYWCPKENGYFDSQMESAPAEQSPAT